VLRGRARAGPPAHHMSAVRHAFSVDGRSMMQPSRTGPSPRAARLDPSRRRWDPNNSPQRSPFAYLTLRGPRDAHVAERDYRVQITLQVAQAKALWENLGELERLQSI
jgi:hypothetical protein